MRVTNQRAAILDFLKGNDSHPTVDEIYEGVKKSLPRISKATVYQNLDFLAAKGLIQEVNIRGVSRFEPDTGPHHHIMCKKCGSVVDFQSMALTNYAKWIAGKRGLEVESAGTQFIGICSKCRRKK